MTLDLGKNKKIFPFDSVGVRSQRGFALITVLSILSLVILTGAAILQLSSTTAREQSLTYHSIQARSNARLALMKALSELQQALGPDTRVSANSSILSPSSADVQQNQILGVWESFGEESGAPFMNNSTKSREQNAIYAETNRKSKFIKWLLPNAPAQDITYFISTPYQEDNEGIVTLIGKNTLQSDDTSQYVIAPKVRLSPDGAYSWWISGENQKARIALSSSSIGDAADQYLKNTNTTELLSPSTTNPAIIEGLEGYDQKEAAKHITLSSSLWDSSKNYRRDAKKLFHTISPYSTGLFTNTSKGGLKKDLNLAAEHSRQHPDLNYRQSGQVGAMGGDLPQYSELFRHMTAYKPSSEGGLVKWIGGVPHVHLGENFQEAIENKPYWANYMLLPTKMYLLLSHYTVRDGVFPQNNKARYKLRMNYNIIEEWWNPFSLPYKVPSPDGKPLRISKKYWAVPYALTYHKGSELMDHCTSEGKNIFRLINGHSNGQTHHVSMNFNKAFQPGELRVYSLPNTDTPSASRQRLELEEGWHMGAGIYTENLGNNREILYFQGDEIVSPELLATSETSGNGYADRHFFTDYWINKEAGGEAAWKWMGNIEMKKDRDVDEIAATLEKNRDSQRKISDIEGIGRLKPLALFGVRRKYENQTQPEADSPTLPSQTLKSKYLLYTNYFNQVFPTNPTPGPIAHSPFEFFVQRIHDFDDSSILTIDPNDKGVMGSAITKSAAFPGQSNVIMYDIPYLPLISMAQLQHARLGEMHSNHINRHPTINFAFANSFASPFTAADCYRTIERGRRNPQDPMHGWPWYNDKSFMLNEILWDTWFMSSLGSYNNPLTSEQNRGTTKEILNKVITGSRQLPNQRYRFLSPDNSSAKEKLYTKLSGMEQSNGMSEGFKKIAAHMTCPGAFNVNSTNINSWRAFLTALNGKKLTLLDYETKNLRKIDGDYLISRFCLPTTDPAETDQWSQNQNTFLKRRWQGARKLSAQELNTLSAEIVKQVKLRGPFLSLADFVNRQLLSEDQHDRHLKGALQAAIDATSINASFEQTSPKVSISDVASYNYKFPEAGTGAVATGAPGYITQADLLTPIASQIRVRDDTFVIRAYGESSRHGKVQARAYCEAVVQRNYNYTDPSDTPETEVYNVKGEKIHTLTEVNQKLGRKMTIISFKWLNQNEI